MLTREDIFRHVKKRYSIEPDYPWKESPQYAVLRHISNQKWFGLLMNITPDKIGLEGTDEIDVLQLKCPPELSAGLKKRKEFYPAYHMNKEHWIAIVLSNVDHMEDITPLIEISFNLTKNK